MASRLKDDEKNEQIIRSLLKLPENKRCINCNSLGPQYVCTTFWTFVCTNCSGIHREFTHRVKSISMAKFTSQEVSALQEGGNQCAKEIYFKGLDLQRQSLPDGSNVERLRDFIRHVYVNKRYAGERNDDKPPKGKMGDKDGLHENRSPGGSSPWLRSPGFEPASRQYSDYKRSQSHPEVVNDWRRDDRFGSGRKSEDEGRSPERTKDFGSSSPPIVRPVRELLGDNVVPLRVNEPPKADGIRAADGSAHTKRTASSSSLVSTNENPQEVKLQTSVSLIDFDADPEPPVASTQAQQSTAPEPVVQPTSSANDNWASFDAVPSVNVSQAPSNANTLDSLLSQLSVPSSVPPVQTSVQPNVPGASMDGNAFQTNTPVAVSGNNTVSPFGPGNYAAPVSNFPNVPAGGSLPPASGPFFGQWPNVQQQPSFFPTHISHSTSQQFAPHQNGPSTNQAWNNTPLASNVQRSLSAPSLQPLHAVSKPAQDVTSGGAQPSSAELETTRRKELPEDLFTATYRSFHAAVPGWQGAQPRGMGFSMQYNAAAMPFQSFQQPAGSTNPFDFSNEPPPQSQMATQFPSMASLYGALPNMLPPSGLLHTPSLGTGPPVWMPSQTLPNASAMLYQMPGHPSTMLPRYTSPPMPNNRPPSHLSSFNNVGASFSTQSIDQQLPGTFSAPPNPHSFPSGGNPFG